MLPTNKYKTTKNNICTPKTTSDQNTLAKTPLSKNIQNNQNNVDPSYTVMVPSNGSEGESDTDCYIDKIFSYDVTTDITHRQNNQ